MAAEDNTPIYDDLMRFKPEGITPNAWAMKAGVSRTVWSDMRRHGNPSRRTLQKLLTVAGSTLAEFEALRISGGPVGELVTKPGLSDHCGADWGAARLPRIPLLATAIAGERQYSGFATEVTELRTGELEENLVRPASLAGDASAYAITIVGNSMWPRFRPGRRVAVSPKAPIAVGDDVLVKLNHTVAKGDATAVLIKELVRKGERGIELRQFNPDVTFHVAAAEIASIEKVVGELI
jgi:hypothetical protein